MRHAVALVVLCLLSISPVSGEGAAPQEFEQHWKQALSAYRAKDYASYLEHTQAAAKLRPSSTTVKYNLAGANALVGKSREALALLAQLADMGLIFDPAADSDFDSVRNAEEFKSILAGFEKNRAPVGHSEVAFTLPKKDLIPEGVAYDSQTETFYVGSIHRRMIVRRDRNGVVKDFATAEDGLWSVFGMKVDSGRRALWACSTATPQMIGFRKEDEGLSSVLRFDLDSGKLVKRYDLPNRPQAHWLGDLAVDTKGNVFVTDSQAPGAVYAILQDKDELEPFIPPGPFRSPQGLDLSGDGKHLFVADYSIGILRFDLATRQAIELARPENVVTTGIDGLYFHGDSLIAIQNGIRPHRVVRFSLSEGRDRIERAEVVEANHPAFDEPTLGVLVQDTLYYVANSQWGSFDKDGTIFPLEKLREPVILRARLR